ncbi:uncharacterized protein LOC129778005 isoform X2 [Toxorhynchites rutilus septentrionalis]|uniref:uncharacterized protein LOC129778005 isoform X2 n=1 Tax=Toxorhynchites rutilus septentrionalis TaxID=329112 RepID=UPI00247AD2CF|nr:uncharacterized protein LOC129778005 isoform X2 [Toxorhynchites rutilus septentrionalis]
MDVELFIRKVKENRPIYDASDKNHSNRNVTAALWRNISEEFNIPVQLRKKWHTLRSNYMRVLRSERNKTPSTGTKTKHLWPYYESLSFLRQCSESKNPSDNMLFSDLAYEHENGTAIEQKVAEDNFLTTISYREDGLTIKSEPLEITDSTVSYETASKKRKQTGVADDGGDLQHLAELSNVESSLPDENDPDRMFLLSLLPLMKQLTPSDSIDFRLNALTFLKERLNPISTGHSSWSQSQILSAHHNRNQCNEWSESDAASSASSTSRCNNGNLKEEVP